MAPGISDPLESACAKSKNRNKLSLFQFVTSRSFEAAETTLGAFTCQAAANRRITKDDPLGVSSFPRRRLSTSTTKLLASLKFRKD